jgi:hypothetical protein
MRSNRIALAETVMPPGAARVVAAAGMVVLFGADAPVT